MLRLGFGLRSSRNSSLGRGPCRKEVTVNVTVGPELAGKSGKLLLYLHDQAGFGFRSLGFRVQGLGVLQELKGSPFWARVLSN